MKKLQEYMKLPYTVMLKRDEDGDIIARVKELEGCVADGQDEIEAIGNLELVKEMWLATALEAGQSIPKPEQDGELPSGKFLMRIPRSLHKTLVELASFEGVSLNQLVSTALAELAGKKFASHARLDSLSASASVHRSEGRYGCAQGVSRIRLVNQDRSHLTKFDKSGLFSERTVSDVLSISTTPMAFKKEA